MSLLDRLRRGLRPRHGPLFAVFLAGTYSSYLGGPLDPFGLLAAVVGGLFVLVVFQFTVGNVWAFAVEYRNAGGRWTDAPFVAPFAVGGVAGAVAVYYTANLAVTAWAAFWAFVLSVPVVLGVTYFSLGYRDAAG